MIYDLLLSHWRGDHQATAVLFCLCNSLNFNFFTGTRPYMAPEILLCSLGYLSGYDHRVDWYSLGICFYEMLMGRRPFEYAVHLSSRQVNEHFD